MTAIRKMEGFRVTAGEVPAMRQAGRDFAGGNTQFVIKYLRARTPAGTVERVLARAGERRSAEVLADPATWSTYSEFRALLVGCAAELGDDELVAIGLDTFADVSDPDATAMLQAFGSPSALYADIGPAAASLAPVVSIVGEAVGPNEWLMAQRFNYGLEPFREYCRYSSGVLSASPRLFGYPPADVTEEACQCLGAPECRFRVIWRATDEPTRRAEQSELQVQVLQASLEALQATVANLVSGEALEEVLQRIITTATRAVRAPGFVLAIEPGIPTSQRVYSDGFSDDEARRIATDLLVGRKQTDDHCLVVDLVSTRCTYGRLAAVNPSGSFYPQELGILRAYGRLAAAALDSAAAHEETRSQAKRAEVLLTLAASLAEIVTAEEMAQRIAQAVPSVVDCDRAIVGVSESASLARIVGVSGYPDDIAAVLKGRTFALRGDVVPDVSFDLHHPGAIRDRSDPQAFMDSTGTVAGASFPIMSNGQVLGMITASVTTRPERLTESADLKARLRGLAGQAGTALANAKLVDQIRRQALNDGLTGLPNRISLTKRLATSFSSAGNRRERQESVLFIDIDDFKDVNDSLGHEGGDALLSQLAERLNGCVRPHDLVARLGGDEFAIVVAEDDGATAAVAVAERILAALRVPFDVAGTRLAVSVSIGVAHRGPDTVDAAELLRHADFAMYMAKGAGKGRYQLFDAQMHDTMVDRAALKTDLAAAVTSNQLRVDYQPVADLRSGAVVGVEALVRWQHPTLGLLAPAAFIPLAEESGDIDAIGCWVLDTATRQVASWRRSIHRCADLWVSVNLSGVQLANPHSMAAIRRILEHPATQADHVVLEVTETALAADVDAGIASLNMLKRLGVRVAIDDFGTGYSSLSTLASLPIDILKIDRSFVSGQASASPSVPMLEGIIGLANKLSLDVIAEGIEEPEQMDLLRTLGCTMGQGFLLARPIPAPALAELLVSNHQLNVPVTATWPPSQTLPR
jgi:diguanylate cyclase (GGDEF)-like protein